ncbi:hypothetical protein B0H11DRAFT_1704073 [Mycena galericulata]|nr:hypothetical protein B0H11DRAFT_1704073 [Mycena galericulata]
MTFTFKSQKDREREKEKEKEKERNNVRAPSPDDRAPSRFGRLRKKVSLASLISSSPHPEDPSLVSRSSSSSSTSLSAVVSPIEEDPTSTPEDEEEGSEGDEDIHAPERFVKKNAWRIRNKMKLHPYPDVPYMQAYDPVVLQSERYMHHLLRRLAPVGSPTFHAYTSGPPPASVLDLGCGSGLWLLDAARTWRSSQFIGFDLVDVTVSPLTDGSVPNVRLVRGDFLKYALPFPDAQFELVRMANLQLAIPQMQWERVLREVWRVLVPGGRLELIHDDTFFPYGAVPPLPTVDVTVDSESEGENEMPLTPVPPRSASGSLTAPSTTSTASASMPSPAAPAPPTPPPVVPQTPLLSDFNVGSASGPWSTRAAAAQDLERVYARMLGTRFGMHPRAGEVAPRLLVRVFGRVERAMSLHLKLAPVGCEERADVIVEGRRDSRDNKGVRTWMTTIEWEKEKEAGRKTVRSKAEQRVMDTPIPQGLSAKAAERLGIVGAGAPPAIRRQPTLLSEDASSSDSDEPAPPPVARSALGKGVSTWVPPSEWDAPPESPALPPSASVKTITAAPSSRTITAAPSTKTIKGSPAPSVRTASPQLHQPLTPTASMHTRGGSTASTASAASAVSNASSGAWSATGVDPPRVAHGRAQHPGLVLWPSTFIPLPPAELEMHTTKHMQTLLACKPALAEFVSTFVDPDTGARLVSEAEFEDAVWDYECFRRPRFNWPDLPEGRLEGEEMPLDLPTPVSARSTHHSIPRTPTGLPEPKEEELHPFGHHELTHVRTLRIFSAVKL